MLKWWRFRQWNELGNLFTEQTACLSQCGIARSHSRTLFRWRLCPLHVFHPPLLNCRGRKKRERSSVNCLAISLTTATLWAKAFPVALHPDDVTNNLAQRGSIEREGCGIHCGYRSRCFNPLTNGGDAVRGFLRAMLRKRGLDSERDKICVNVRSFAR